MHGLRKAAAAITLLTMYIGLALLSGDGLEGPKLYVYPESGVYRPGSTALFRVLALDADGNPRSSLTVIVSLYGPDENLVEQFEGETDGNGWLVVSFSLSMEGLYRVTAEDPTVRFIPSEATVLVCSMCPQAGQTAAITNTLTTTVYHTSTTTVTTTFTTVDVRTEIKETTVTAGVTTITSLKTVTAPFTVTRDVTRFETVILSVAGPTATVTQYSTIIPAPVTVTTVRESAVDASLIVYFGIGMMVVIAVAAAVVAQRIKQ